MNDNDVRIIVTYMTSFFEGSRSKAGFYNGVAARKRLGTTELNKYN